MDLICMNSKKEDVSVLLHYDLDLAFGSDENDFECTVNTADHCCEEGYYLYIEGTEYGGIVDSVQSDTERNEVTYYGRTWQGVLGSKVIMPLLRGENYEEGGSTIPADITQNGNQLRIASGVTVTQVSERLFLSDGKSEGVDVETENANGSLVLKYLIISGDANACLQFIIDRVGLSSLFQAAPYVAGVSINQYQFNRYTDAYTGVCKMLESAGLRLSTSFKNGKVVLSAVERYDYTQDEEFNSDQINFRVKKNFNTVNHLVCLGSGELADRMVVHLYADEDGNISQTQTLTGEDEYVSVFDYPNAESEEELIKSGTSELKALWGQNELSISFDPDEDIYGVGDIVGAYDNITRLSVSAEILKKIVTIKNGQITISYEVGEK